MSLALRHRHSVSTEIDGSDLEFEFPPSDAGETFEKYSEDRLTLVLGYLSHDDDCSHPLDDCDGMGKVIGRGKYETRNHDESEMREALALNSEWEPDLEQDFIERGLQSEWEAYVDGLPLETQQGLADTLLTVGNNPEGELRQCLNEDEDPLDVFQREVMPKLRGVEIKAWNSVADHLGEALDDADMVVNWQVVLQAAKDCLDFDTQAIAEGIWAEARAAGEIGDPDAVILDVYDHSGIAWSVTGGGMQCRWDTSSGAGVWVPDDCCREEIERRAKVYAHYWIEDTSWLRGQGKKHQLQGEAGSVAFSDDWGALFDRARYYAAHLETSPEQLRIGRRRAARELAEQALETYNEWLSGDCWGVIVEKFTRPDLDSAWEEAESADACWGFIGSDYAEEEMKSRLAATSI